MGNKMQWRSRGREGKVGGGEEAAPWPPSPALVADNGMVNRAMARARERRGLEICEEMRGRGQESLSLHFLDVV